MENEQILSELTKIIPKENIKINELMSKHTSFKVGGPADYYIIVKTIEQMKNIVKYVKQKKIQTYTIGNGSNLLVGDKGYRGIILKNDIDNLQIEQNQEDIYIYVGAGYKVMALGQILKQKGIAGFEELSGIPGTIGGANYMNAGAYGKEMKDIIIETKVLNKENLQVEILSNNEQKLEYRSSIFQNKQYIILQTTIKLNKGNPEEIKKKMNGYFAQRKEKQPIEYPSAGSTFKREKEFITAKLIDESGLKGYNIGGAQISEKHAGFIINKENATAKDIIDLIQYTKNKVFEKFGVTLREEVEIIGDF